MLFSIVIHMKLRHNMLDMSHALCFNFSTSLLLPIVSPDFSLVSTAKSRSKTVKWKWTCLRHLEKFKPINIVTTEVCESKETTANT